MTYFSMDCANRNRNVLGAVYSSNIFLINLAYVIGKVLRFWEIVYM